MQQCQEWPQLRTSPSPQGVGGSTTTVLVFESLLGLTLMRGSFSFVAHGASGIDDMVVHGSFTSGSVIVPDVLEKYNSTCSVNGVEGYGIAVYAGDGDNGVPSMEDWIIVLVTGDSEWYSWWNYLKGGNIKIH